MNWRQFYGGKYVSAKNFGNKTIKSKIVSADVETIKNKDKDETTSVVIEVNNYDGKFVLNKGNCERISKKYGDDISKWVGKTVKISTDWTTYQGDKVRGLVIEPVGGKQ